ncbi:MAG: hypothetical protein GY715_12720 [Planctomycetes bacterium]|nr:hypothetical protein [Planctomycetota bacterium]
MNGRLPTSLLAAAATIALGSTALGQSFNIDFGDDLGTPDASYGAAGAPGVWNTVVEPGVPHPLVGLDGRSLQATVTTQNEAGGVDDEATGGSDEQLFDDGLFGLGDVVSFVTFENLAPGRYAITAYAWTPITPAAVTTVMVDDNVDNWGLVGGAWPGALEEGITHATITGETVDGTLVVQFLGSIIATEGFLNGIQLVRVDPVGFDPADLDKDGFVGFADLLILLSNWTTPGHGCNGDLECIGDLDGDTFIDFADVLLLIGAWTP